MRCLPFRKSLVRLVVVEAAGDADGSFVKGVLSLGTDLQCTPPICAFAAECTRSSPDGVPYAMKFC